MVKIELNVSYCKTNGRDDDIEFYHFSMLNHSRFKNGCTQLTKVDDDIMWATRFQFCMCMTFTTNGYGWVCPYIFDF